MLNLLVIHGHPSTVVMARQVGQDTAAVFMENPQHFRSIPTEAAHVSSIFIDSTMTCELKTSLKSHKTTKQECCRKHNCHLFSQATKQSVMDSSTEKQTAKKSTLRQQSRKTKLTHLPDVLSNDLYFFKES